MICLYKEAAAAQWDEYGEHMAAASIPEDIQGRHTPPMSSMFQVSSDLLGNMVS